MAPNIISASSVLIIIGVFITVGALYEPKRSWMRGKGRAYSDLLHLPKGYNSWHNMLNFVEKNRKRQNDAYGLNYGPYGDDFNSEYPQKRSAYDEERDANVLQDIPSNQEIKLLNANAKNVGNDLKGKVTAEVKPAVDDISDDDDGVEEAAPYPLQRGLD